MLKLYKFVLPLVIGLFTLIPDTSMASHLTGADIQYACIGRGAQDTMKIRINLFRDCAGIGAPTTVTLPITNSCGITVSQTMSQISVSGIEVSFLCGPLLATSTCNGGTLPGMEIYTYEATYILPPTCNGSLQATATGGSPGFNYSWPMGMSGTDVEFLCAGEYIVTIQDNNGCIVQDTHRLTDVTNLYLTSTVTEISCNGLCDGAITVAPTNGNTPYVYNWEDGTSTATRTNLCPGIYSVTVMDGNGSQFATWINIENPVPVFAGFSITNESCFGACDGVIRTEVNGGKAPYTYAWSGGLTGNLAQGVCPGSYNVTVTDANGCSTVATAVVNAATTINSSALINTPITCNGACNGSVSVSATGGATPYTFTWDNGFTGITQTGLCAGTYNVTTTDANFCTDVQTITLTQPTALAHNGVATNSSCLGSTGSISLTPSGGNGPYNYAWNILPNPGNVGNVTTLSSGVYGFTVTDANGCQLIDSIAVSDVGGATTSGAVIVTPACAGLTTGSITLTPGGGSTPYSYAWSDGSTGNSISALGAGNYAVTITDNGGCKLVEIITVTEPQSIDAVLTVSDPICNGACDGSISLIPSGGTGGYNVLWSNGGTGLSQTNLCSGTYSVTITDGSGCSYANNNIVLTDPVPLTNSIGIISDIDCYNDTDGQLLAVASGGTAPYTYAWSNGATLPDNYDLSQGSYYLTVTDASGCTFLDTVTLTQPLPIVNTITQLTAPGCSGTWAGGWGSCCRPTTAAVNTSTGNFYSDFEMNLTLAQKDCNNGVSFEDNPNAHPLRYVCLSDTLCYNFGVQEADGDSLVFALIPAKATATTNVVYNTVGGVTYSGTNPINGITLNSATGEICFVATPVGRFVVAIEVTEYDPVTGLFKGRNMRDILFIIEPCPPNAAPTASPVNNFTPTSGSPVLNGSTIEMCEGDAFCFDVVFHDSNLVDTNMFVFSNVGQVLVGPNPTDTATIVNTTLDTVIIGGDSLLEITSTICWAAPPLSGGVYNFYVALNDDHCQVPKDVFKAITVNVTGSTVAWPDATICGNQTSQIFSAGGTSFGWQSISGDPIQVGVNFSCDSCASPVASPSQTTVYVVTSNISSLCQNMDTVTITVAPDYQVIATPDTILCNIDTVQLNASATIPGLFTYQWNNSGSLSNPTIANPTAVPPGSTIYSVTMTSADGCQKNSTANVFVTPPFPILNPIATDTVLCGVGDTTTLDIEFLTSNATTCGPSYSNCLSTVNYTNVGTATTSNGTTAWPAPFGNFRRSARHQMLYRASELTALGLKAGMITEIGFDVASVNGTASYTDYEVKMGCTALTTMPASFQGGLTTVFPAGTVIISTGWNMIQFSTPYIWDGTSNIIIDVCFDMLGVASTTNASTRYSSPGFTSTVYYENNFNNACTSTTISNASFFRPNTRFGFCAGADPAAYTYAWSPTTNMSNPTITNPMVWPDSTTTYEVIVNDTFGVCSDSADITIYVGEIEAGPDTIICPGDSIMLNGLVTTICPGGTDSISWTPAAGLNDATILNPTASVVTTTTFVLNYTNSCGCTMVDSVTIVVDPLGLPNPIITDPTCGLADGEIILNAVGGSAPYEFSIDSGNTFQPVNLFTNLAMGGYAMQIMDSNGCLSPILIDTLINPGTPVITDITLTDPSCFGFSDGQIAITAVGGTNPLRYTIDSVNFTINNNFSGLAAGNYTVIVQDDSLCQTFPVPVQLVSNTQLFLDSIIYQDLNCFEDSSGWLQVYGQGGTNPLEYSIDNGTIYSADSLFVGLSAGNYDVIIRDSIGCTTTAQIQTIAEPAELLGAVYPVNDTCFNACGGSASVNVSGGTAPYVYSWRKGINQIGFSTPNIGNLCAGTDYEFKVTDSNNCETFVPFIVGEPDELVISFVEESISCFGSDDGKVSISAVGGTAPYTYSIDGGLNFQSNAVFTGLIAGKYDIMVADSGARCTAISTFIITEPTEIQLSTNITAKQLCVSGCTQLVATATGGVGTPYNYIWTQGFGFDSSGVQTGCPTQTTVYSVYAVDSNGCTSLAKGIVLTLFDSLSIDAGTDVDLCLGDTAQLNALVSGGDGNGYNFSWSPVAGLSDAFIANPIAYPLVSTTYVVRVSDNCETPFAFDSLVVNLREDPTMDFYADSPTEGCEPFDITLVNASTPVQFAEWTIGDDITALGFTADITDLTAGIYDVKLRVVTPYGCEGEIVKTDFIDVKPLPTADFTMDPRETTVFNTIIQFEDLSLGDINAWDWDFSGNGQSTDQNPLFQYPSDTGDFVVTLRVTTVDGCEDETEEILRIGGEFNVYVPNSFTPNGDGQNDVFAPRAVGLDESKYKLMVYDRWGGLIFESNNLAQPWDGRVAGTNKIAENGVYVWRIVAQDNTDNPEGHIYHGTVTLIR